MQPLHEEEDASDEEVAVADGIEEEEEYDDTASDAEDVPPGLEATETDDEQEAKEVTEVPYPPGAEHDKGELEALIMQDLKTEDARQDGGYARRRIARGSVVLVRGDEEGQTVTWVARVDKLYKRRGSHLADIFWFYRLRDVPAAAARRAHLADDPRQILLTDDRHTVEARFIRHPAHAWFLTPNQPAPAMRCGQGASRHTRPRPGFLVRHVYDTASKRVFPLTDPALARANPGLAGQAEGLLRASRARLAELAEAEGRHDGANGLSEVQAAPFVRDGDLAELLRASEPAEGQGHSGGASSSSSSSSSSEGEDDNGEGEEAEEAPAVEQRRQERQASREQERREEGERREEAARQERQAGVDAEAAKLAQLLAQERAAPPVGSPGQSTIAAALGWRRCAQQLQRQAGELPRRQAPPPALQGSSKAPQLDAAEVQRLAGGAVLPNVEPLAALLRALCSPGEQPAAARELLADQQLMFFRVLLTWAWHLAACRRHDLAADPALCECGVLVLGALERCPYTPPVQRWLGLVQAPRLIRELALNSEGAFPAPLQQAAQRLKSSWADCQQQLIRQAQERRRQRDGQERRERQREAQGQKLLQQSPQAAKALSLATSGRRLSALGAGGGAMYVKQRQSPQPAGLRATGASATQQQQQQQDRMPAARELERRPSLPPLSPHVPSALHHRQQQQQQQQQQEEQQSQGQQGPANGGVEPSAASAAERRQQPAGQQGGESQQPPQADDLKERWLSAFGDGKPSRPGSTPASSIKPAMQRSMTLPSPSAGLPSSSVAAKGAHAPPNRIASAPAGQQRTAAAAAAAAAAVSSVGQKRPAPGGVSLDAPLRGAKAARRDAKPDAAKAGKPKKLQQLVKKAARSGF